MAVRKQKSKFDVIEPDFEYKGRTYVHHSGLSIRSSAFLRLDFKQIVIILAILAIIAAAAIVKWHTTLLVLVAMLTVYYVLQIIFDLTLSYRSLASDREIIVADEDIKGYGSNWPKYTILCPLYKEEKILPQFVSAMKKLDYPKAKLQIMLLLEENDEDTIKAAKKMKLPKEFTIVVVPQSFPQTKPKALNFGLKKATGKYSVIYDAEDIPEPRQLKRAVIAFEKAGPRIGCVQAKLDYYNPKQNLLTRLFTAEYALWFDLVLPGLQSISAPIPLGGTSNHFEVKLLKELGGWDAFNVTEDADLGIRLSKQGFITTIVNSFTFEEASSDFKTWLNQRQRWVKGYIQTYFVHSRSFKEFENKFRQPDGLLFQATIGGKVALMFINPIMLVITVLYFSLRSSIGHTIQSFFPAEILYMAIFSIIFGNFMYVYFYMLGCAKRGHWSMVKYSYLMPLYWLAMSLAAYMALFELIVNPHYWHKTPHGNHLEIDDLEHSSLSSVDADSSKSGLSTKKAA